MKAIYAILCGWLVATISAGAQSWVQTQANTNYYWYCVAASADGTKLAATVSQNPGEGIYLSTNSGSTWTLSQAPAGAWGPIASSADGSLLAAGNANGHIYASTNSGISWNQTLAPLEAWSLIASSADGTRMLAIYPGGAPGPISISTNSGNSWMVATNLYRYWRAITCSADGSKLAAVATGDGMVPVVSTNYGATWVPTPPLINQSGSLAAAADGSLLMLAGSTGFYVSTNWGTTWSSTNDKAPVYGYTPMVCSANGALLLSCFGVNYAYTIYTSTNFGSTWMSNSVPQKDWTGFAVSADGNKLVAVAQPYGGAGGGIWISQTPASPQLNVSYAGNSLNFSWIIPSTNMLLEESPDLINWSLLTNAPLVNNANLQAQLNLTPASNAGFFRLSSQ
jgi:hypothetical protein